MKKLAIITFLFSLLLSCQAQTENLITPDDANLVYTGRVSFKTPGMAKFTYPGVQIHANFTGTSIAMKMKPGSGFYMIELDNQKPFKVESKKGSAVVPVASGLSKGKHHIIITSCDEGIILKPEFYGLILDKGETLAKKPELPTRRMEFIGNSITCALGIEDFSKDHKNATPATQNAYYSFAAQTARNLNSQFMLVSRSGIGIYRNTGGKKEGDKNNMQAYYPNTLFDMSEGAEKWDFSRYTPDVVCINLGTNDTTYPAYDINLLTNAFVKFVHTIRGNYPKAKIVLLSGTMRKGKLLADLKLALANAMDKLNADGVQEVYRFDFTPADGSLGYGSFQHPSLKQHTKMAEELTPFLRKIMNW